MKDFFWLFLDEECILNVVIFFVEKGVVVNLDRGMDLFLYFVVVLGLWRMIEFLIEKGVSINYVGNGDIILLMKYILKNGNMYFYWIEFY